VDWKTALLTFGLILFAELGDKTQLAVIALSARTQAPWTVFAGAAGALLLSTFLAALLGETMLQSLPVRWVRLLTGLTFLFVGALLISKAYR
jgi:Ca2+/H+ antiporter, TMEM165/GDT1 family